MIAILVILFKNDKSDAKVNSSLAPQNMVNQNSSGIVPKQKVKFSEYNSIPDKKILNNETGISGFNRKMVLIKFVDGGRNLISSTGYVVKVEGKIYILSAISSTFFSSYIKRFSEEVELNNDMTDIIGTAFVGTPFEVSFRLKIPIKYEKNEIVYLEPIQDISYLDSFSVVFNPKISANMDVTFLGCSLTSYNPKKKIFKKEIQSLSGSIYSFDDGSTNFGGVIKNDANEYFDFGFVALNGNNEILGVSKKELHKEFRNKIIFSFLPQLGKN